MNARRAVLAAAAIAGLAGAPARAALPPITHVFVVVLENQSYDTTFGKDTQAPYLARRLPARGLLLTHYYGIGHESLDNYVAMISGQGPNPQTQADCPIYSSFLPGTIGADGQATGIGCVYPAAVKTVADQLTAKGLTWGGFMEDMGNTPTSAQTCRHPVLNQQDKTQSARAGDQYAARHNPFVYFHSIIDSPDCAARDVPLDRLGPALDADQAPSFAFITPNLCHDGHDMPCKNGEPGGMKSADLFLRKWVPVITGSRAYRDGGLLIVLFDEASSKDATACCVKDAPNTPSAGGKDNGPGGGRVGAVLLSPYIRPGSVDDTPYNHYSLLRSVEDLFGLTPLGLAAKATGFGADVYNGPTCVDLPLPNTSDTRLPAGTLISGVRRQGRKLTITTIHTAKLVVRARVHKRTRRVARRSLKLCATTTVTLPRGTRSATITASVGARFERRSLHLR